MSDPGQAARLPQRRGRRAVLSLLRVVLAVPVLASLALCGLALRLWLGPVEVGWLAHRFAPARIGGEQLGFGSVTIELGGRIARAGTPLLIAVRDLTLTAPDRREDLRAEQTRVSLALAPLLSGIVLPESLSLRDAALSLRRDAAGRIGLRGGGDAGGQGGGGQGGGGLRLDRLRALDAERVEVSLRQAGGGDAMLRLDHAALRPLAGLAAGTLSATLAVAGQSIPLTASGDATATGVRWRARTGAVEPARLAALLPALAAAKLPVAATLDASLDSTAAGPRPTDLSLELSLGAGTLDAGDGTLPVASGEVALHARPNGADGVSLELRGLRLAMRAPAGGGGAPVFTGSGTLSLDHLAAPRRIRASLAVNSDRVGFDGLGRYWPEGVAVGARRWVVANITGGVATTLHVETVLASESGWAGVSERSRSGGFDAEDLTLWWLRPMPPLERMRAHVILQGPDALLVQTPQAVLAVDAAGPAARRIAGTAPLAPLAVSDGTMRITGLDAAEQIGQIDLTLSGGLRELLAALANPRLRLLSAHPLSFTAPTGSARSIVSVRLPLDDRVGMDAVTVSARSTLRDVHLGDVAAGMSLDGAGLAVDADTDGLVLSGRGRIGGLDATLRYAMDFRAGPPQQLVEQASVQASVRPSDLSRLGFDAGDALTGSGALGLEYGAERGGRSSIALALDMTGLGVALPVWSKRAGAAAKVDARIVLQRGRLQSVGPIHADGPGLSIEGDVQTAGDGPRVLTVRHFRIGRTGGAGRVSFPRGSGGPVRIAAHGPSLDLAAVIDAHAAKPSRPSRRAAGGGPGPAWVADLRFDRVFVGRNTELGGMTAHLEDDGSSLRTARVTAATPTALSVSVTPVAGGGRAIAGTAADTGALLVGLGVTNAMSGGAMRLEARLADPGAGARTGTAADGLSGTVRIGPFELPDAPLAARIARDASIYGFLLAPRSPSLRVDRLVAPFSLDGDVLTLIDARAHSPALGLTMRGTVDLGRQLLDLRGTVVPAWALNQLPGRLPLVGRLLSPEKGGGLVAMTLGVKGSFADPRISLNPLSALAPGFLRLLFE